MKRIFAIGGVVAVLAMSACGSTDTDSTASGNATSAAPTPAATSAAPSPSAMPATFGAACSAVPTDATNPGSFDAMSKVPVATAASGNPLLSTLVTAVTKAQLGDTLNSAKNITVFAPTNDAFGKIPADALNAVLANDAQLKSILTYHVVGETVTPDKLAGTFKTLQGTDLTVAGSGSSFTVNGAAAVICGNVQTANATVYIIDTVLMPKA
ncbi:MAG TPA: fasciclin domain-containing protein [Micromonosporaceae bacterium]|nr:fasciclin domain-containing protein [Micromonosporaceae bacterium]